MSWKDIRAVARGSVSSESVANTDSASFEQDVQDDQSIATSKDGSVTERPSTSHDAFKSDEQSDTPSNSHDNTSQSSQSRITSESDTVSNDSWSLSMEETSIDKTYNETVNEVPVRLPLQNPDLLNFKGGEFSNTLPTQWTRRSSRLSTPHVAGLYTVESLTHYTGTPTKGKRPVRKSSTLNRIQGKAVANIVTPLECYSPTQRPLGGSMGSLARRCQLCRRRFEGDPCDVVVGYLQACGHYFHCLCIDTYVTKEKHCPICPSRDSNLEQTDIQLSLLSDILIDLETNNLM